MAGSCALVTPAASLMRAAQNLGVVGAAGGTAGLKGHGKIRACAVPACRRGLAGNGLVLSAPSSVEGRQAAGVTVTPGCRLRWSR